jgi:hypothetical protein
MRNLFGLTKGKCFLAAGLFAGVFVGAQISARVFRQGFVTEVLLFPFRLYLIVKSTFRRPGYDDIMLGPCRFPHCDLAAWAVSVAASALVFYGAACFISLLFGRQAPRLS